MILARQTIHLEIKLQGMEEAEGGGGDGGSRRGSGTRASATAAAPAVRGAAQVSVKGYTTARNVGRREGWEDGKMCWTVGRSDAQLIILEMSD